MDILLVSRRALVPVRPIAAIGSDVAPVDGVAGQVAADIAIAALGAERATPYRVEAPMRDAAEIKAPA